MSALDVFRSELTGTVGIAYIGVTLSSTLYGVTCIQAFYYFRSPHKDRWYIPTLVVVLWVLDTLHQAFTNHVLYHYLINEYANPLALLRIVWTIPAGILVNAIVAFLVDVFLLWRLWSLSNNKWYTSLCGVWVVGHMGVNMTTAIRPFFYPTVEGTLTKLKSEALAGLAVDSILDLLLAAGLVYYLHNRRTGFHKSGDVITKLIVMTVSTGFLTTLFVIAEMVSYIIAPADLYVVFFNFLVGKLYINTLLTSLNYRDDLRARLANEDQSNSLPLQFRQDYSWVKQARPQRVVDIQKAPAFDRSYGTSANSYGTSPQTSMEARKTGDGDLHVV